MIDPPRGMYPGKLDDKGRLKVPADLLNFLTKLPEKLLFLTSVDRDIAQLYPMSVWRENEKLLEAEKDNPEAAEKVAFNANDLGANVEIDSQGRITFPVKLRDELRLHTQGLHLYAYRGHIEILSDEVYQKQKSAGPSSKDAALTMKKVGLK